MHALNPRTIVRAGCLLVLIAAPLRADLVAGDTQYKTHASTSALLPKHTAGLPTYFSGGNLVDSLLSGLTGFGPLGQVFTGNVQSAVYRNPDTGFLTFDYQVNASANNTRAMTLASIGGAWSGVTITRVGADGSGSSGTMDSGAEWHDGSPASIERADNDDNPNVSFYWRISPSLIGTVIGPGNSSGHMWIETNVTDYGLSGIDILGFGVRAQGGIYAPAFAVEPIPEPGAVVLGLIGMGGLGCMRRMSRRPA